MRMETSLDQGFIVVFRNCVVPFDCGSQGIIGHSGDDGEVVQNDVKRIGLRAVEISNVVKRQRGDSGIEEVGVPQFHIVEVEVTKLNMLRTHRQVK